MKSAKEIVSFWRQSNRRIKVAIAFNCLTILAGILRVAGYVVPGLAYFAVGLGWTVALIAVILGLQMMVELRLELRKEEEMAIAQTLNRKIDSLLHECNNLEFSINRELPFAQLFDMDHAPTVRRLCDESVCAIVRIKRDCRDLREIVKRIRG